MLIKNVHIDNQKELNDVRIEEGKFAEIGKNLTTKREEKVIEGKGCLLLPPFVESHIHLDTLLTAGQPRWNESGTLFEGIQILGERRKQLTVKDVQERAKKSIELMVAHGIQYIRSHVDITDPQLISLQALLALKEELKDQVTIQLVAFPQDGILSSRRGKELMIQAIKEGADVVGGIPHMEFTTEDGWQSVHYLMDLAEKYDRLVDMHCDEVDDSAARNLEVLAADTWKRRLYGRVTASHTTAMGSYNNAYASKLLRLLRLSNINIVANPLVNVHLGGRFDSYPKRRGVTRIKNLTAAQVNVSFGEDDMFDPMNALGDGNLLDAVSMAVYLEHMMGYHQIQNAYKFITYNGAKTLNIGEKYGIKVGNDANCILLHAPDFFTALNKHVEVLYNIRQGKIISQTIPAQTKIKLN